MSDRSTVIFGFPNNSGAAVSPALSSRGINLLRASPSSIKITVVVEMHQKGYAIYKDRLGLFMASYINNKTIPSYLPGALMNPVQISQLKFVPELPAINLTWTAQVADEILEDIRNRFQGTDTFTLRKPGLSVKAKFSDIQELRSKGADIISPCPRGTINLQCMPTMALLLRIANVFLAMHQYPAFEDDEHYDSIMGEAIKGQGTPMVVEDPKGKEKEVEYKPAHQNINCGERLKPYENSSIYFIQEGNNHEGLYFSYISDLALYDAITVPQVVEQYFKGCLGEDAPTIHEAVTALRSAWGVISQTEFGNILSHLYTGIRLAIESQGVVRIHMPLGVYEGFVLLGAKFSVSLNGKGYVPRSAADLNKAVHVSGRNGPILQRICSALGRNVGFLDTVTSFRGLRRKIYEDSLEDANIDEVKNLIPQLSFPEFPFWVPSADNICRALKMVAPGNTVDRFMALSDADLPIGPAGVLSHDLDVVVLSCFGFSCPSFVIPYGGKMTLEGDFGKNVAVPKKGGKADKEFRVANSLSVRLVSVDVAVQDHRKVMNEKAVWNPFAVAKAKRSAQNQYKTFTGEMAKRIVAELKNCSGVAGGVQGTKRKEREADNVGEGPSKKAALSWDF